MADSTGRDARSSPPPSTGAWRPDDPPGSRRFSTIAADRPLSLESGATLGGPDAPIQIAYESFGELSAARDNAILVLHALTGDSHVCGDAGPGHPTSGWWEGMVGSGKAIDTDRFFVIAPNVLGSCQGSTGPASEGPDGRPYASRFPQLTIRDQVAAERSLADELEIGSFHAVIGGSMGGMRALEWALLDPDRVGRLLLLACAAAASAEQIALCSTQIAAIEADPHFKGGDYYAEIEGPWRGLGVARRIGQISYRTRGEFTERFGREHQDDLDPLDGGRFSVEGYLDHHAAKLAWRFDANSYVLLSRAMNLHDVGRGRGGIAAALRRISAPTTVIGFHSDRLYPLDEQQAIAQGVGENAHVHALASVLGHDAFLLENAAMTPIVTQALA